MCVLGMGKREDWEGFCERVPGNRKMAQISGHPPRILCSHMERKQRYRKFRLELPTWEAGLHGDFSAGTFLVWAQRSLCMPSDAEKLIATFLFIA